MEFHDSIDVYITIMNILATVIKTCMEKIYRKKHSTKLSLLSNTQWSHYNQNQNNNIEKPKEIMTP